MKKVTLLLLALLTVCMVNAQSDLDTIYYENFESYTDFAFDDLSPFTQIDNDMDNTYGIQDVDYPNTSYVGTGMIFNPSQTSPPLGEGWEAHSGQKGMYFFASQGNNSGTPQNDDYLILPQISLPGDATELTFSMFAKEVTDQYGPEQFEVLLSTTGNAQADFTENVSGGIVDVANTDYQNYAYDLSAFAGEDVYIAIHYVTQDVFVFMTDDYLVTSGALSVASENFNGFNHFVANGNLNLSANIPMQDVQVYNLLGQQVIHKELTKTNESIDLNGLNSGVYLSKVMINGEARSFKFVKK